jgi:uncharacterized protein (TIGR02117 family)
MKLRYKLKKYCKLSQIAILSAAIIIIIGALTPTKWFYDSTQPCDVSIYVINVGLHSDIILPVRTDNFYWNGFIPLEEIGTDTNQNYNYLGIGWGEHDFYINTPSVADIKVSTVLKALFYPNNSAVMHVRGFNNLPDEKYFDIKCVRISYKQYLRLVEFIKKSFSLDRKGNILRIANGYNAYGGFYNASGTYSILRNCNNWTAEALKIADVNTPTWSSFSTPIMWHMRNSCHC